MYVVLNEEEQAMHWDTAPWGDGECLIDGNPLCFTVFGTEEDAVCALGVSREFAKREKLVKTWKTKEWKVIPLIEFLYGKPEFPRIEV